MPTLTVRDQTMTGQVLRELLVETLTERVTVRELIESRVRQEVESWNRERPSVFRGLVEPRGAEAVPGGSRPARGRPVDADAQCARALEAFARSQVLVLVGDRQAESLDETIVVAPDTRVSFLRLTPLVGG